MRIVIFLLVLLLGISFENAKSSESPNEEPQLSFPLQFSAKITITAHLIDVESEYPPRTRNLLVYYDYLNKKARVDIEAGYEAAKIHIRKYNEKLEYMIRLPPIADCKRSYLGEIMPFPAMPTESTFIKSNFIIRDTSCDYFLFEETGIRIHMYMSSQDGAPVQLIQESFDEYESTPMLTYDYTDVKLEPPSQSIFHLPNPYTKQACDEHRGGFPYIHIFHYFVRF